MLYNSSKHRDQLYLKSLGEEVMEMVETESALKGR